MKLNKPQAELIQSLFCDQKLEPSCVASEFYKAYPRSSFKENWHKRVLREPDLFIECDVMVDAAMVALDYIVERGGKTFMKTDSPFFLRISGQIAQEMATTAGVNL